MRDLIVLGLSLFALSQIAQAEVLHQQRSMYRNLSVEQQGDLRCLKFHTRERYSQQSCILVSQPEKLVFHYTKQMLASLLFVEQPKRILIIGLGGGSLSNSLNSLYPDAEIVNVELDDAVFKVAREFFNYRENQQVKTVVQDGRLYVKRALLKQQQFDLILLDAFNGDYIPEHLMTKEFLQECQSLLSANGVLAANTFSVSKLYQAESATYQAVFGDFYQVEVNRSNNRIIIAAKQAVTPVVLQQRAVQLAEPLTRFDVNMAKLARAIHQRKNWPDDAPVLTDQYAPANLLNSIN